MAKKIGSFTLGGSKWIIELDNRACNESKSPFEISSCYQKIRLCNVLRGEPILPENMEKYLWEAILYEIVTKTMEHRKYNVNDIMMPYSSFVLQVKNTLTACQGDWNGTFQLGGKTYQVKVDNQRCENYSCYGICFWKEGLILLSSGDDNEPYTNNFIQQTLWHEICHAIAFEMGRGDEKLNGEKFVNPMSVFLCEVFRTLKIKYTDE